MKEYIERKAALEILCDGCCEHTVENPFACEGCEQRAEVLRLPAADVAPVVHGEWITCCNEPRLTSTSAGASKFWFTCSICGRTELKQEPYCHCGAKMDGGNE